MLFPQPEIIFPFQPYLLLSTTFNHLSYKCYTMEPTSTDYNYAIRAVISFLWPFVFQKLATQSLRFVALVVTWDKPFCQPSHRGALVVLWQEKLLFKQLTWVRFPADAGLISFKGTCDSYWRYQSTTRKHTLFERQGWLKSFQLSPCHYLSQYESERHFRYSSTISTS